MVQKPFSAVKHRHLCPSWLKDKSWHTGVCFKDISMTGSGSCAPVAGGLHRCHVLRCGLGVRVLLGSAFTPSSAQELHSVRTCCFMAVSRNFQDNLNSGCTYLKNLSLKCSALWGKANSLTGRDPMELGTDFQSPRDKAVSFQLPHTPLFTKPLLPLTAFCGITDWRFHLTLGPAMQFMWQKDAGLDQILKIWSSVWCITCCAFR